MSTKKIDLAAIAAEGTNAVVNDEGVINLTKKDAVINLSKAAPTLKSAEIGLGWTSPTGVKVDLDLSAYCLDGSGKATGAGFLFYGTNNGADLQVFDNALMHTGDDEDGSGEDEGPDEVIIADLAKIPAYITSVVFVATVHEEVPTGMKFDKAQDAFMNIVDADSKQEILHFNLTGDFSSQDSVEFIRLNRKGDEWEVKAVADGSAEGLLGLCEKFGLNAAYKG